MEDLKNIYILFVRSQLEQSAVVWHSSLTDENKNDLERVQKTAVKIILGDRFQGYKKGLDFLNLLTLEERREYLCLKFCAEMYYKWEETKEMFPLKEKHHNMDTRKNEKYKVQYANTERLKKFAIIYMQNLLNEQEEK